MAEASSSGKHTPSADDVSRAIATLTKDEREQVRIMRDGELKWSATHGWPSLCDALRCKGMIRITGQTMWGNLPEYRSEMTLLGIATRAALSTALGEDR